MLSMLSVEHKSSPSKVYQTRQKCGIYCWLSLKDLQSLPAILSDVLKQWSTPQFVLLRCFNAYVVSIMRVFSSLANVKRSATSINIKQ